MILIVAYPPGAGGNHLRNMLDTDARFRDQWPWDWVRESYLGSDVYASNQQPVGTAHSIPGRNMHAVFVEHMRSNPGRDYLLQAHFGELALYKQQISSLPGKRIVLISIDSDSDKDLLLARQNRLGQLSHPYWIREEQPFLYRADMYVDYFGVTMPDIFSVPLTEFWRQDFCSSELITDLERFTGLKLDRAVAQNIHNVWLRQNFA